jgi:hypothetical protein
MIVTSLAGLCLSYNLKTRVQDNMDRVRRDIRYDGLRRVWVALMVEDRSDQHQGSLAKLRRMRPAVEDSNIVTCMLRQCYARQRSVEGYGRLTWWEMV